MAMPMPVYVPEPEFKGLGVMPAAHQAVSQGQQGGMRAIAGLEQQRISDEQKQKASQFQKLLASGLDGVNAYATEVAEKYPDLGQQFSAEAQSFAPLFQDPNMTGEKAREILTWSYDSMNRRMMERDKLMLEPTAAEKEAAALSMHRKKKEIDQDFERPRAISDSAKDRARKMDLGRKTTDVVWGKIKRAWETQPQDPELDPDAMKEWRRSMDGLQKELNTAEGAAGEDLTKDIFPSARGGRGPSFDRFMKPQMKGESSSSGTTSRTPSVGETFGGYKFKGGDPNKQESWEKVE